MVASFSNPNPMNQCQTPNQSRRGKSFTEVPEEMRNERQKEPVQIEEKDVMDKRRWKMDVQKTESGGKEE